MQTHIIEQTDEEGTDYDWIGIDEQTARDLFEAGKVSLYFVREDAEGLIQNEEDLEEAIEYDSVGIEDSYSWHAEYEEGAQNRYRNNVSMSFEQWIEEKIESYY